MATTPTRSTASHGSYRGSGSTSGGGDDVATVVLTWLVLPLAAIATCLSGLAWLAGQLSAVLSGNGWPNVPVTDAPGIGYRLVDTPSRPDAAWPRGVRDQLGPGWLIWAMAVMLLALVLSTILLVAYRWATRSADRRADAGARWATRREELEIAVADEPADRPGRLVAGRGLQSRRLLAADDCISAVGFGPNGSGKTTGLIAPNVLEWAGSVVMTTTKVADVALIHDRRATVGPVWVIAPGGADTDHGLRGIGNGAGGHPVSSVGWSPVDYARDAERADRMAEWLVEASGLSADAKSRPWLVQARKYVKPLLLAAHLTGGGVEAFVRWVYAGQDASDDIREILLTAGEHETWREYASTWSIHAEGIGSVLFTAYGLADAYSRPSVRTAAARGGFSPEFLFGDRPGTLVIIAAESDVDRFAPLLTALLAAVVHEAEHRAAQLGGPLQPRLLLALDEAGNVFRYPRVANLLTTARGNGIQLLLVYHDVAQIEQLFGRTVARTVLSNAKLRILLPGQGDLETLRWFTSMLGQARVARSSTTRSHGGQRSTSTGDHAEDLAPIHVLRAARRRRGRAVPQPARHAGAAAVLLRRQDTSPTRAAGAMTTAGERSDHPPVGPTVEDLRLRVDVQQLGINRLTAEATKLGEQLTEVRDGLQDQIGDLVGRAARNGDPADGSGRAETPRPWNLRDLDEPGRLVLMREVGGWVDWLLQRYPLTATIPPCWAKHPEMVEELIAAHRAWTAAYRSPNATAYAPAEWHDRWLPGLEQRLVHRWKSRRCDDGHQPSTINTVGTCLATRPRIEEEH